MSDPTLSLMIFIPLLGMAVVLALPSRAEHLIRWTSVGASVPPLLLAARLLAGFAPQAPGFQFEARAPWIPAFNIEYFLGVDGISITMVVLTALLSFLCMFASFGITKALKGYFALFLLLETGMMGTFLALDFFLFYVFWELMLLPMYFLIGIWGGPRREYAAIKFFLYTLLGSVLMLVALLYLYFTPTPHSFDMTQLGALVRDKIPLDVQILLWVALFIGFAIKIPAVPFHTWLPDAHVEAPTAISVILAGILLKMGTYGFLRFALPFFPGVVLSPTVQLVIVTLSLVGILYGGLVAMVQPDFKKLIAYSSVAHLGFVMLGIWALTLQSVQGALLVMINHGISTGALFFLVGMIYERRHSRLIDAYGGIARVVPLFAAILTVVSLSSIGLPGTNGFVGEFLVLLGAFRTYPVATALATTGVIIAAAYLLWALQRVLFNPLDKHENEKLTDLTARELIVLIPLLVCIVWIGVYPKPFLTRMEPAAQHLIEQVRGK